MTLRDSIRSNVDKVKFTFHALKRFQENNFDIKMVLTCLRTSFEVIEEYIHDSRGSSALILLFLESEPFHLVVAPYKDELIIITGYRPDESEWEKNYSKRK